MIAGRGFFEVDRTKNNMSIIIVLFVAFITIFSISCNSTYWYRYIPGAFDPYAEMRPDCFPTSVWVCNDPQINLSVDENHKISGEIIIDYEPHIIKVEFVQVTKIFIYVCDNDELLLCLEGTCDFKDESFSVEINKNTDKLFYGKYDKIVFLKQ